MKDHETLNVAIVGGGMACKAIIGMIFAERLSQLRMKLIGVADIDPMAVGYRYAQEKGIFTTKDYRDLYQLEGLIKFRPSSWYRSRESLVVKMPFSWALR